MALYLEQYLDTLEGLPGDLRKNLSAIHELDSKTQDGLRKVDQMVQDFIQAAPTLSAEKKRRRITDIQAAFGGVREKADEKVGLATSTYELVDKHIRRLDSDLARFEGELKQKVLDTKLGKTSRPGSPESPQMKKRGRKRKDDESPGPSKKRTTAGPLVNMSRDQVVSMSGAQLIQQLAGSCGDVLDMPVDPNEPTYCICHQVSHGEMVACDNDDCPIEWFHFGCVGLTTKPKGKWYCPRCRAERKK